MYVRVRVCISDVKERFCLFDIAKLRTKKHPMKQSFIGWEFVGVWAGVLPFSVHVVGVFRFLVGVLGSFWEFWWEFFSGGQRFSVR